MVELIAGPELAAKDVEVVTVTHGLRREGGKEWKEEGGSEIRRGKKQRMERGSTQSYLMGAAWRRGVEAFNLAPFPPLEVPPVVYG